MSKRKWCLFYFTVYQCFWKYWKANWGSLIIHIHFMHIIMILFLCFSFICNFYIQIILIKNLHHFIL